MGLEVIFLAIVTFCAAKEIDKIKAINNIGGIFTLAIAIGFTVVSFFVYALFALKLLQVLLAQLISQKRLIQRV